MPSTLIYRFYVYAYLRESTSTSAKKGTPYYIGKGQGNRAFTRRPNERIKCPRDKKNIIIIEYFEEEAKAFEAEMRLIKYYGRIDNVTGILRNLTDGGEGGSGRVKSEEERRKISERMSGENHPFYGKGHLIWTRGKFGKDHPKTGSVVSEEGRKRLSESKKGEKNPRYGKPSTIAGRKFSDEEKKNVVEANKLRSRKVKCLDTGIVFGSLREAQDWLKSLGIEKASRGNVQLCASGERRTAHGFRWSFDVD